MAICICSSSSLDTVPEICLVYVGIQALLRFVYNDEIEFKSGTVSLFISDIAHHHLDLGVILVWSCLMIIYILVHL